MKSPEGTKTITVHGDRCEVDERVVSLVEAMNLIPGVLTFSSCGGHAKPTNVSQKPRGYFYVAFDVHRNSTGFHALGIILAAMYEVDAERLELTPWLSGEGPETLSFQVNGRAGADPDALAKEIRRAVPGR